MGFSAFYGWYEHAGLEDMRLQAWFNQNYRFLPADFNLMTVNPNDEASVINGIACSVQCLIGTLDEMDKPEKAAAFKKWLRFANSIRTFLGHKRDLFGQPGSSWVDGSAHCIGDRGYLFFFRNTSVDRPANSYAVVPLNEMIGLTKGRRFLITQIYPKEGKRLGIFARGAEVPFSLDGNVEVYSIIRTKKKINILELPDYEKSVRLPAFARGNIL